MRRLITLGVLLALWTLGGAPGTTREPPPRQRSTAPPGKASALASPVVVVDPHFGYGLSPCLDCQAGHTRRWIAKKGHAYDTRGLRVALLALKQRYTKPRALRVSAWLDQPWRVIAETVAAARVTDQGQPLFPVIFLSVSGPR